MDTDFWLHKWHTNDIGFHQGHPNQLMTAHLKKLGMRVESRVFLPLCGKTKDISWLLENGYKVVGAELVESAIEQLFAELGIKPRVSALADLKHYAAKHLDIYVGDIFDTTRARLGKIDAVYDRAALVALPAEMRQRYANHLIEITGKAPQLLICFEYDQNKQKGPPFSIDRKEIDRLYGNTFTTEMSGQTKVQGGLKGRCEARETVWLLTR